MFVFEKSFQQIWRELTKKGWTYKKSTGLSNDQRSIPPGGSVKGTEGVDFFVGEENLMRYCRRQGWLSFVQAPRPPTLPVNATAASAVTTASPDTRSSSPAPATPASAEAARTPLVDAASPHDTAAEEKRSYPAFRILPPVVRAPLASVEQTTERAVPETTHSETAGTVTAARLPDIPGSIPFDEFDSENFLDALRRDQLFAPTDGDDLNIGRDDRLLALDSEEEGDEGSILLDEVSEEEGKSDAEVDEDADLSDDDAEDEHSQDEVPVAFDLTEEDLD
ncbi:hypothetical protein PF008_g19625, partial [Phytophthora fragariae]